MALLLVGAVGSSAASASSSVLYLSGGGVPVAQLSGSAPGGGPLPNYDPGRDSFPGLLLKESDEFAYEDDPTKYQAWVVSGGMTLAGNVSLTFWSAMKDFKTNKEGGVDAFLFDCNSGGSCNLLGEGYANVDPWNPGGDWVSNTINFGSINHTVAADRTLVLKVVVCKDDSEDDMWFAYGTSTYPSALTLTLGAPPTTTTTTASTTTTLSATTTTTVAPTTTAPPTTTTTMAAPPVTTTTQPPPAAPTTHPPAMTTTTTSRASTTTSTTRASELPVSSSTTEPASTSTTEAQVAVVPETTSTTTTTSPIETLVDPALQALPSGGSATPPIAAGMTMGLIEGLELIVPPAVAAAILSPLLILEFLLTAVTGSLQAVTLPVTLFGMTLPWLLTRKRWPAWMRKGVSTT